MRAGKVWPVVAAFAALWVGERSPASAQQVSLTKNSDLAFGWMVTGATAGTVRITPAGAVSSTGGVRLLPSVTSAAGFTLANGLRGRPVFYFISAPVTATLANGPNTMTVNTFQVNPPVFGRLGRGRSRPINVGATLNVGANQPSGTYMGIFQITVFFF